jgi:serine/threonine protein kinase
MSPEQLRADPVDGRSDVFSLGVVLYECLTGVPLFSGRTLKQMIDEPLPPPEPPSVLNENISEALDAVVLTALEPDVSRRFPSAREMARGIEAAGGNEIWPAEMCGELVTRFFPDRQEQAGQLLQGLPPTTEDPGVTAESGPVFAPSSTLGESSSLAPLDRSFAPAAPGTLVIASTLRSKWPVRGALGAAAILLAAGGAWWALSSAAPAAKISDPPLAPTTPHPSPLPLAGEGQGEGGQRKLEEPVVEKAPAAAEAGWLTVDSKPWARIEVDGKEIGVTPISHYRLKPGPHALEAVRSDGHHQSMKVRISPRHEEKWWVQW